MYSYYLYTTSILGGVVGNIKKYCRSDPPNTLQHIWLREYDAADSAGSQHIIFAIKNIHRSNYLVKEALVLILLHNDTYMDFIRCYFLEGTFNDMKILIFVTVAVSFSAPSIATSTGVKNA